MIEIAVGWLVVIGVLSFMVGASYARAKLGENTAP